MPRQLLEHPRVNSTIHSTFYAYGFLVGDHHSVWGYVVDSRDRKHLNTSTWYFKETNFWIMKFEISLLDDIDLENKDASRCQFQLFTDMAPRTPQCSIDDLRMRPLPGGLEILHPSDNTTVSGPNIVTYGTTSETISVPIQCAKMTSGSTNVNALTISRDKDFWVAVFTSVNPATYDLDVHHNANCTGGDTRSNITVQ